MDREGGTVEPIPPNGARRTFTAFISGGLVALALAFATALITLGGERNSVLSKVAEIPHIHDDLAIHIHDVGSHLDSIEAVALTTLPLQLEQIQQQLARMETHQIDMQRQIDRLLRRP